MDEFEDKGVLGQKLGIDYILDDAVKVAKIAEKSGFKAILFGEHDQFHKDNPGFLQAKTWKMFRKLL